MNVIQSPRTFVASVVLVALSFSWAASAQDRAPELIGSDREDWPQWRGPRRDGISQETGLLSSWPEDGPSRLWTVSGIGRGYSSPIVVDETVYVTGDDEENLVIRAFSIDGALRWYAKNGAAWEQSFPGARSSCTYDNGKLYHMNAHGRLVCLDARTGKEQWVVNVLQRFEGKNITWGLSESLLVFGDLVFATPCGAKGLVVSLNKQTGKTVWATPALEDEEPSYASPILVRSGDRNLLVNSAIRNAFAVDVKTGELCWKVPQLDPKNTVSTIPVLGKNEVVLTNSSRSFGGVFGVRLDGIRAERTWTRQLSISHGSTVCVDGQVFAASSRGEARGWVAVDAATGTPRIMSDLARGSLIYADGHFYCLTERGMMTLQKPAGSKFEMVGSFQFVNDKDIWAHPVICNGRLFLRFHETLSCYDIRQSDGHPVVHEASAYN